MLEDAVFQYMDPAETGFVRPQVSFIVGYEEAPAVVFDIDGDMSLCKLVNWLTAGGAMAELQELVADIAEALARVDGAGS